MIMGADTTARVQRYSSDLPDAGLRRGVHRAGRHPRARINPLDGRPHISDTIRQFPGDSRGWWEGDTLVVETTNFVERRSRRGSTGFRHVVERFTRVDANTIRYEFTIDDPTTSTRSWSAEVPVVRTEGPMFEYACHEGNHDIRHILES